MKVITLIGPFTESDVTLLMETLRYCERKQPCKDFLMTVESDDDQRSLTDMREYLKNKFPAVRGVPVTVETFKRED